MTQRATWPIRRPGQSLAGFVERVDHRSTLTRKAVSGPPEGWKRHVSNFNKDGWLDTPVDTPFGWRGADLRQASAKIFQRFAENGDSAPAGSGIMTESHMPVELDDANLLKLCADYPAIKKRFEDMQDLMDPKEGNAADRAYQEWIGLQDKIQETRPVTVAGLAAKAQICQFAFLENRSADKRDWSSEDEFAFALMQDVAGFGMAARFVEQAPLTAS